MLTQTQSQSAADIVLTLRPLQLLQPKFKFQVVRFMHHDRQSLDSQQFTFKQLKSSPTVDLSYQDSINLADMDIDPDVKEAIIWS